MPYKTRADLPETVRQALPTHAADIYKDAFNNAYEQYGHDEARTHRVAWSAVKRKYHKDERAGKWVEGPSPEE